MKSWNRRKLLRGLVNGAAVSVALPMLDCFLDGNGEALADGSPIPVRFGTWFWGCGINDRRFYPDALGREYELKAESMPLNPFKPKLTIFSGFNAILNGQPNLTHWSGTMALLSGTVPSVGGNGVGRAPASTIDCLVADHMGTRSRFKSIQVACTGQPNVSYSMREGSTINPSEVDPVSLYMRIFGEGFRDPNAAEFTPDPAIMLQQSVLSSVAEQRQSYLQNVGAADRARLEQYFTSLREVEQQLAAQLQPPPPCESCVVPGRPDALQPGATWEEASAMHDKLTDLLVMALACNQTRVFHVALSAAVSNLRRAGQSVALHELTHEEAIDPDLGYQKEATFFLARTMGVYASLLAKMEAVKEGAGTLLDHSLVMACSESNLAKLHTLESLPIIVAGTAGGRWRSGGHIAGRGDTVARVGLTIQQSLGVPIGAWGTGANLATRPVTEVLA